MTDSPRRMATGLATLLTYLRSPDRYNFCVDKTRSGLSRLHPSMAKFPESEMSPDRCRTLYRESGEGAIAVREEIGLAPQVVDWFLFAVGEIRTKPGNPGLRALIEGRGE